MLKKAVFPGKYIQGVGAIGELPGLIDLLGKQGLVLASPSVDDTFVLSETGLSDSGADLGAGAGPESVSPRVVLILAELARRREVESGPGPEVIDVID